MDIKKLKEFLVKAKKSTYANNKNKPQKRSDGARVFSFVSAEFEGFKYEDIYFGSSKFVGQEVVWHNGIVIWSMVYYGGIVKDVLTQDTLFNRYLKKFLSKPDEIPARGEDQQIEKNGNDKVIYTNHIQRKDPTHFNGREFISYNGNEIYELFYAGGIVIIENIN